MKKIPSLLTIIFLTVVYSHAQFARGLYKNEFFQDFLKSTTYVARTGDSLFDAEVEKGMAKQWKITPYEIVDEKTFSSKVKNPKCSFLSLVKLKIDYWGYSNYTSDQIRFQVSMGCPNYPNICGNEFISNTLAWYKWVNLLSMSGEKKASGEKVLAEYYRLQDIIGSIHLCLEATKNDKLHYLQKKDIDYGFVRKYFNKGASAIKTKTLYILKTELRDDVNLAQVAKNYPYKLKIVNDEEMRNAILREDKDVVYMVTGDENGPTFYDIASHKAVGAMQYGYHEKFRTQDFKDIASFVKEWSKD